MNKELVNGFKTKELEVGLHQSRMVSQQTRYICRHIDIDTHTHTHIYVNQLKWKKHAIFEQRWWFKSSMAGQRLEG